MPVSTEDEQRQSWPFRRKYGLGIAFASLWLILWAGQFWTQWHEFVNEQHDHGESARWGDYLWQFAARTLENDQSEMFQVFMFVGLSAFFFWLGSAESKDSDERIEALVRETQAMVQEMRDGRQS